MFARTYEWKWKFVTFNFTGDRTTLAELVQIDIKVTLTSPSGDSATEH